MKNNRKAIRIDIANKVGNNIFLLDFFFNFQKKIAKNNKEIYSDFIVNDNIIKKKYSMALHVAIRKLLKKNKG